MKLGVAIGLFAALLVAPAPGSLDAPVSGATGTSYQEPYSWGAMATGGNIYGQYSAPVIGASALSTTAPAGGGTLGAKVSSGAPVSKFAQLEVFGGGTPLFFSKGAQVTSTGVHVLAAVRNSSGAHEVWGWGTNAYAQLGNGTTAAASRPVKATWTAASGEEIISLAVGERHSLMLTNQGSTRRVYAWGSNGVGQVGGAGLAVATSTKQTTPMLLSVLTAESIQSIAAGRFHSVASDSDGEVWVWGYDVASYGNIGLPGERSRYLPEKLTASSMGQRSATVTHYAIKNNLTTLTTSSYHYFEKLSTATVNIGIPLLDGAKSVSSVANTTFTYTAQPNVASTAVSGGSASVAYTAPSAAVSSRRIASNVAAITVPTGHNFKAGNVVTVNVGDPDFDGSRTLSSVTSTELRYTSQPNVASVAASGSLEFTNPNATVTYKRVLNNEAILTLAAGHNLQTGNIVNVNIGDASFDGTRTVTASGAGYIKYISQPNVASTAVSPSGAITAVTPTSAVVTNRSMAAPSGLYSLATLTVPVGHGFEVGNTIVVDITGANEADFDGTWDVYSKTNTSISFRRPALGSSIASGSTTGSVTLTPGTTTVTNKAITSNVATVTVPSGHGFAAGNVIDVAGVGAGFDGRQTITSATATTISFEAQDDVTNVAASGTVAIATTTVAISNKAITSNDATITLPSGHGVAVGNTITVTGLGGNFDGTKTVTGATATTATYTARGNVDATASSGTATMTTPTLSPTNKSITDNVATLTVGSGHAMAVGNTITVTGLSGNFDGAKTITAVAATTISYKAQADVATTPISGTAVVTDCTSSCPTVPSGVLEVAAGNGFTVARTASSVLTWGYTGTTNYTRVGRTNTSVTTPSAISIACTPSALSTGPYGGAVLCSDNSIVTWGDNREGQLGSSTAVNSTGNAAPKTVGGISLNSGETIASVDMSIGGGMALTSAGRLFTWGTNKYRLLGNDKTYAASATASAVPYSLTAQLASRIAPTGATIAAATFEYYTGFVIDSTGKVWTWGWAGSGMTGRGVSGPATTAAGARFYSLGIASSTRIELMDTTYWGMATVLSDGSLWTMGAIGDTGGYYYNGDGTSGARYTIGRVDLPFGPDTSSTSETITQLSCGTYHCLLATSAGKIYGWGDATNKNVVYNGTTDITTPTLIASGLTNPRIAAGTWFSLYVDIGASGTGGTVYAWGTNSNRRSSPQTSASTALTTATAVQDTLAPTGTPNDVVAISAGTAHAVALRANGSLMAWGSNAYGQLGAGNTTTTVYYSEPTLPNGKIAASIHAAGNHTIVRATDGTLVGWGSNLNNVLAGASSGNVTTPTNIASGYTFSQVDTYGYHATASIATAVGITTGGTVMTWGSNQFGQLGRTDRPAASSGGNMNSATPVVVQTTDGSALTNADKVVATGYWSAGYRVAVPLVPPSAPLSVTANSTAASSITASWSVPSSPRNLEGYVVEVLRSGSVVFRAGAGSGATSLTMAEPTFSILNGQTHTVRVYAVNAAGESVASNDAMATPVGVPGAPQSLSVLPLVNGLRVTFATPTDLAGLPIDDYEIVATPTSGSAITVTGIPSGSSPYTVDITSPTYTVSLGTEYIVTVRAHNSAPNTTGWGPAATSSAVIPGRPTAPLNVAVLGLGGAARVSWDEPVSDGGASILSYVVKVYLDGTSTVAATSVVNTGLGASMTADVSGLTNGTRYEVTVTASQELAGTQYFGVPSSRVEVVVGRPAAPTNVAATATNFTAGTHVAVTWTKVPDQTGVTVSHYRVNRTPVGGSITNGSAIATGAACTGTSCTATVTGLTNGTEYTFVVEAGTTSTAWGLTSAEVTATPIGATSAPGVDVTPADSSGSVVITTPTSLNGSDVINYEVTYQPTLGGAASTPVVVLPNSDVPPITGLTNGTSYTVSVVAVNGAGRSTAGTATFTPATTPGAPTNVRARPGSIIVTWDPPTDTGGASITSYEITVTDPDGNSSVYAYNGSSNPTGATSCTSARSCTITQIQDSEGTWITLPDDLEYTVEIRAITSAGTGPPSDDSLVVSGQPDAPTNLVATSGLYSFELCWTPPTGSITSYKISAVYGTTALQKEVLVADVINSATCVSPKVGVVVDGWDDGSTMVAGGTYAVTVAATVSASDYIYGLASDSVNATPYGPPGAPTITDIQTTATTATITWSAAAPYGSAILAYLVQTSTGESCATGGALSCTISGLVGNATYSFTVTATNDAGDGPPSAAVSAVIDATAPTPSWSAPTIGDSRRPTASGTFDENVYYVLTFDEAVTGFTAAALSNAGTAGTCGYAISQVIPNRQYNVVATCAAVGTLVSRVASGIVTDNAGNTGPTLTVDAALVTLNDPITTTTTTSTTTTSIAQTTTTNTLAASATSTTTAGATTTTDASGSPGGGTSPSVSETTSPTTVPGDPGAATQTTLKKRDGATTTTIGGGSGLPPAIDDTLRVDEGLLDDDEAAPGESLRIERCGFAADEIVELYVGGNRIRQLTADDDGCIEAQVTVPASPGKKLTLALYAPKSGKGVKAQFVVTGQLAATGSNLDGALALALMLLILGAVVVAWVPRRRRRLG